VYNSFIALTGPAAAIAGLALGYFVDRKGLRLFYIGTLSLYGILAIVVGLSEPAWTSLPYLMMIGVLQACIYQGTFISFLAIHMNISWIKVAATQFSLYMAWVNIGRLSGPAAIAALQPYLDWNQIYFVMALCLSIAVVLVWNVKLPVAGQDSAPT
jgi:MFS transporter, PAT family, beta-lactamase induction signal transducer AmpG